MALYKTYNEIWPPYHALQNQPRCNSLTSLPWHYQTQAFVLASVSSICGPSLPGMFFSQISLGHLLHVILVSAQISPQKSLLWSPWLKQPHCSCPISHYPVSFFFSWHFCYRQLFYSSLAWKKQRSWGQRFCLVYPQSWNIPDTQ